MPHERRDDTRGRKMMRWKSIQGKRGKNEEEKDREKRKKENSKRHSLWSEVGRMEREEGEKVTRVKMPDEVVWFFFLP